jgi:hypothetical protein
MPDSIGSYRVVKRFFSSWQGFTALVVAVIIYLYSPSIIRAYDPTAGLFDGGYLQWLLLSITAYFVAVWATWTGWQLAFPCTDKESDRHLSEWFKSIPHWGKWVAVQTTFCFFFWGFIQILKAIPLK